MKIIGAFFIIICSFVACSKGTVHKGKTPLVEVDGQFLYQEDLQSVLPPDLSKDDSVLFLEHYIRDWAENSLLYHKAEKNIPDNDQIDRLVDSYRKTLITHTYQQELINQELSKEITDEEIERYYNQNRNIFVSTTPLIKGLFIKVPLKASGLNNIRTWYKKNTPEIVDKLDKYSLRNAVSYKCFYDKWVPITDILDMIPLKVQTPESYLEENRHIELKDSAYYYFLTVSEYLKSGQQEPLEYAKAEIKDMLINLRQVEFMQKVKGNLYRDAVNKNKIKYY